MRWRRGASRQSSSHLALLVELAALKAAGGLTVWQGAIWVLVAVLLVVVLAAIGASVMAVPMVALAVPGR